MGNIAALPLKWLDEHSAPQGIGLAITSVWSRGAERGRALSAFTLSLGALTARDTTVRSWPSA